MRIIVKTIVFAAIASTQAGAAAESARVPDATKIAAPGNARVTGERAAHEKQLVAQLLKDERQGNGYLPAFVGDFDISNWTLINTPADTGGNFNIQPGPPVQLFLVGGDNQSENPGDTDFQIAIPADGTLTFDWGLQSGDEGCFDSGGYLVNGAYTELACNEDAVPFFAESATVPVSQGDTFAFRVHTENNIFGSATLGVTNFQFLPLGAPEIAIDPLSFGFIVPQDETDSATLNIENVGKGTLTWTIVAVEDIGPGSCDTAKSTTWLSVQLDVGTTIAGETSAVQVDVDATGLAVGNYDGILCIDSNDGAGNEHLEVPVALEVTIGDAIFAHDFECAPGLDGCPVGGTPGVYTDRDEFLAHVGAGFYEENFASVGPGNGGPSMDFSGNGFAYTISAVDGLFNGVGFISTSWDDNPLVITFTGAPVTAIGGNFWPTDFDLNHIPTDIVITLSNGTVETFTSTSIADFRGFVTKAPIASITIDAPDDIEDAWATLDNIIVGQIAE